MCGGTPQSHWDLHSPEKTEKGTGSLALPGEDGSLVCLSLLHRHLRTKNTEKTY